MSRPVQYNNKVKMVEAPESLMGDGFMATSFEKVVGLARKNSIWPLPFATSCCVLNLWLPWPVIMTLQGLVPKGWAFLHGSAIY